MSTNQAPLFEESSACKHAPQVSKPKKHYVKVTHIAEDSVPVHKLTIRGDISTSTLWLLEDPASGSTFTLRLHPKKSWGDICNSPRVFPARVRAALHNGTLNELHDIHGQKSVLFHKQYTSEVLRVQVRAQTLVMHTTGVLRPTPIYELEYIYSVRNGRCRLTHTDATGKSLTQLGLDGTWIQLRVVAGCTQFLKKKETPMQHRLQ